MRRTKTEQFASILKSAWDLFLTQLGNKYIAFVFLSVVLVGSYLVLPVLWKYIFSALVSYFAATLFLRYSLDKGLFKAKRFDRSKVSEGHSFLIFIFVIIFSTFISNWIAGQIASIAAADTQARFLIVLIQTVIILTLIFLDIEFEF
jgi:hypothetical protein